MIHRAPFGSMERFIGVLIEHFAGAFPLWLAPVQAMVLPISEKSAAYGQEVRKALADAGLRVEIDVSPDKIGAKIRLASLQKVPYMLVVGEQEQQARQVALRSFSGGDQGQITLEQCVARLVRQAAERA